MAKLMDVQRAEYVDGTLFAWPRPLGSAPGRIYGIRQKQVLDVKAIDELLPIDAVLP